MKPWEIVTEVLKMLQKETKVGVKTQNLDRMAEEMVISLGGTCYNKGYTHHDEKKPFPASLCVSVNAMIAHGIPTDYALRDGDIVNLDIGVKKDGLCGDAAFSMGVGEISRQDYWLLKTALESLYAGLDKVKANVLVRDVSHAMEWAAKTRGFVANRTLCGHTISKEMHEEPLIPNFYIEGYEEVLKEGTMICLEPMVSRKDDRGVWINEWEIATRDKRRSAMFEHQVLVTKTGYELLTKHITPDFIQSA